MEEGDGNYFAMTITLDDVRTVPGMIDESVIDLEETNMDPTLFRMENYGYWPAETNGFFSALKCERIKDRFTKSIEQGISGHSYVVGVDVADRVANSAIVVLDITDPTVKIVCVKAVQGKEINELIEEIRKIYRNFYIVRGCMDSKGGGTFILNELMNDYFFATNDNQIVKQTFDLSKLELVNIAHPLVDEMNWNLRGAIENEQIKAHQ